MKNITAKLGALKLMLHDLHLHFTDYSEHLLADKLQEGINDNIDRLKELEISYAGSLEIASALESASSVLKEIQAFYPDATTPAEKHSVELWKSIRKLYIALVGQCKAEIEKTDSEGIMNALADISEGLMRNKYLVDRVLKGYRIDFKK